MWNFIHTEMLLDFQDFGIDFSAKVMLSSNQINFIHMSIHLET